MADTKYDDVNGGQPEGTEATEAQPTEAQPEAAPEGHSASPQELADVAGVNPQDVPLSEMRQAQDRSLINQTPPGSERPNTPNMPAPPPNEHPDIQHASKLHRLAEVLAGGRQATYKMVNGELVPSVKPLTGGQIAMGIVASILGGMGASANSKTVGEAAGKGFEYGKKMVEDRDEKAKQQATADYTRKAAVMENHLKQYMNQMAAYNLGADAVNKGITLNKPLYDAAKDLGVTSELVWGEELHEYMKNHDMGDKVGIPYYSEQKLDDKGEMVMNERGIPAPHVQYAILDANTLINYPAGMVTKNSEGKDITIPKDARARILTVSRLVNDQHLSALTEMAFKDAVRQSGGKTSDAVAKDENGATKGETKGKEEAPKQPVRYNNVVSTNPTFDDLIAEAAAKNSVDANELRAIINQESQGNPKAVSPKGAQGLMQIMPENQPGLGIQDPFDPKQNINGGAKLWSDLKTKYKGNVSLALAAYNAGEGAVNKGGAHIPQNGETENYVKNITKSLGISGDPKAAEKSEALGLELRMPTKAELDKLPESAKQALGRMGGHLDGFFDRKPDAPSTAEQAVKSKQMSQEDYGKLVSLIHSADGKFDGEKAITEDKNIRERRSKVQDAQALADIKAKSGEDKKQAEMDIQWKNVGIPKDTPLRGKDLLAEVYRHDVGMGARMEGITNYDFPPNLFSNRSNVRQFEFGMAKLIDPSFDESDYDKKQKAKISWSSGGPGSPHANVGYVNTLVHHLDLLKTSMDGLHNTGFVPWNYVKQEGKSLTVGNPAKKRFDSDVEAVAGEASKLYKGTSGTEAEIKSWKDKMHMADTPDEQKAGFDEMLSLMGGRLDVLNSQYLHDVGTSRNFRILLPETEKMLKKYGRDDLVSKDLDNYREKLEKGYSTNLTGTPSQKPSAAVKPPAGATHIVPGPDGKKHYTNATGSVDLGVVPNGN